MKPIQHAACLCALSALLALSPAVALCENTPAENQQAEDSRLQTGKQANLRKLPNKKSDKLETLKKGSVLTVISVSEINGEGLSSSVGGTNQLWIDAAAAKYFTRNVVAIELTAQEVAPDTPGTEDAPDDQYVNRPNAGITKAAS